MNQSGVIAPGRVASLIESCQDRRSAAMLAFVQREVHGLLMMAEGRLIHAASNNSEKRLQQLIRKEGLVNDRLLNLALDQQARASYHIPLSVLLSEQGVNESSVGGSLMSVVGEDLSWMLELEHGHFRVQAAPPVPYGWHTLVSQIEKSPSGKVITRLDQIWKSFRASPRQRPDPDRCPRSAERCQDLEELGRYDKEIERILRVGLRPGGRAVLFLWDGHRLSTARAVGPESGLFEGLSLRADWHDLTFHSAWLMRRLWAEIGAPTSEFQRLVPLELDREVSGALYVDSDEPVRHLDSMTAALHGALSGFLSRVREERFQQAQRLLDFWIPCFPLSQRGRDPDSRVKRGSDPVSTERNRSRRPLSYRHWRTRVAVETH